MTECHFRCLYATSVYLHSWWVNLLKKFLNKIKDLCPWRKYQQFLNWRHFWVTQKWSYDIDIWKYKANHSILLMGLYKTALFIILLVALIKGSYSFFLCSNSDIRYAMWNQLQLLMNQQEFMLLLLCREKIVDCLTQFCSHAMSLVSADLLVTEKIRHLKKPRMQANAVFLFMKG